MPDLKLYLHIGTEKTGSSFLQSQMVCHRETLQQAGIWFPKAGKWEREMKAGRISPGNGVTLWEHLRDDRMSETSKLLRKYQQEAEGKGCHAILLSNENLLEVFSKVGTFEQLQDVCAALSVQLTPMLLLLRNPVGQALSLYKHRAKNGKIDGVESWVAEGYQLAKDLDGFLLQLERKTTCCILRKYRKDSHYLMQVFFGDWLGLPTIPPWQEREVNPSLSLSELVLMRQVRQLRPTFTPFLYQRLLSVPTQQKSDDLYLKRYTKEYLNYYLARYQPVWQRCNKWLPEAEKLQLPVASAEAPSKQQQILTFTSKQTQTWMAFIQESTTWRFQIKLLLRRMRKIGAKVKWTILDGFGN